MLTNGRDAYIAACKQADGAMLRIAFVWASREPHPNPEAKELIAAELLRRVVGPKGRLP